MHEVVLYDPNRRPPNWTDLMQPGQYAVFHTDAGTDVEKSTDGRYLRGSESSTCLIFDSLAEAETYCEARVEQARSLRCDIYDHLGKGKPPLAVYVNRAELKRPRKRLIWGWILVAASLPLFWLDWRQGGAMILPTIVGINLIFAGLRLVYWSAGSSNNKRATREAAQ